MSCGVAGATGLQWSTVRNMLMARVLTLPASTAFVLFVILRRVF